MVPRARPYVLPGRCRNPGLPHCHWFRAGPPRLRHPTALAAGHRGQRHRQWPLHDRPQPLRQRGPPELLRFILHLGSVRPHPGPGTPRRIRRPGGRSRPGPAQGLAHALPVPGHPPPGNVRPPHGTREPQHPARPHSRSPPKPSCVRMSAWRMPSETAPQDRVWMAFPTGGYTLGDTAEEAHAARSTWAAVANAILEFEPVTMVVHPDDVDTAARYLDPRVEVLTAELNDAWMRDIGPSFVLDANKQLGAVDWIFNGWGGQDWATWDKDSLIAAEISARADAHHIPSGIVNEGGGIQVDGEGTVLVTETVQLDQGRNPGLTKADIEGELARTIGATHVIWLPRG